jgi:hypothetical protein
MEFEIGYYVSEGEEKSELIFGKNFEYTIRTINCTAQECKKLLSDM